MQITRLQYIAALAAAPFYILLFPFGLGVHIALGGLALCYAFRTVDNADWCRFLTHFSSYSENNGLYSIGTRYGLKRTALFIGMPLILSAALILFPDEVHLRMFGFVRSLLGYSLLPHAVPQFIEASPSILNDVGGQQFLGWLFFTAILPLPFSQFWIIDNIDMAFRAIVLYNKKHEIYKLRWVFPVIFAIIFLTYWIIFQYSPSFNGGEEVRLSAAGLAFLIFFMGLLFFYVHGVVCAKLATCGLPSPVEKYLESSTHYTRGLHLR